MTRLSGPVTDGQESTHGRFVGRAGSRRFSSPAPGHAGKSSVKVISHATPFAYRAIGTKKTGGVNSSVERAGSSWICRGYLPADAQPLLLIWPHGFILKGALTY